MSLFQEPAKTPEEIAASAPLDIPPETVAEMDEEEWYARAYRHDAPQLTVRAVAIGTVLGFFLAFTNVYIGLKTGWFLGVNLTACILTFAISSALPGKNRMSILESTCAVSTASSAGYATGFLAVTAAPAMLLLSVTQETPDGVKMRWPVMALWIFFLAALGVVLAIPMKRNMINTAKLKFPSGTAAAVTLQGLYSSGAGAMMRARALFTTAFVSALVPLLKELEIRKVGVDAKTGAVLRDTILPGQSNVFDWIPKILPESWTHRMLNAGPPKLHPEGKAFLFSDFQLKLDHGLALAFAGIIIGFRITFWMVIGGLVTALLVAPPALDALWTNALGNVVGAANKPQTAWKEIGVWCGAPLLVASGLVTFSAQWRTVGRAFSGMFGSAKKPEAKPAEKKETKEDTDWSADPFTKEKDAHALPKVNPDDIEVPNRWFASGIVVSGIGVITVAWLFFEIPPHLGLLAVAMTFVLAIVACRATGESDITPGGPFGKIMQLTYGILIPQSSTANLQTAAITASASLSSADLLNDLKCGYLLGANPRRQFVAQAAGILTGTIATTLCYFVLVPSASVMIGTDTKPPTFPAPGAQQWKAVAEVFKYGLGNLHPMAQAGIKWGVVAGVVLAAIEIFAPKKWKIWVPSPTGIGLGMVLPFFIPLSMFLGALFGTIATAVNKTWSERYILAIAAGGIAGESIIGVLVQGLNNFVLH